MLTKFWTAFTLLTLSGAALADMADFRITQQTGRATQVFSNIATVESETDFENFIARTNNVTGTISFDPETRRGSGNIVINGKTLTTGVDLRDEDMRGERWLNFNADPTIRFVTTDVRNIGSTTYRVNGNLTLKGVTKPVTARVTLRYTPAARVPASVVTGIRATGDIVAMTAKFSIKLSDFGVDHPAIAAGRVNNTVDITVRTIASTKFQGE